MHDLINDVTPFMQDMCHKHVIITATVRKPPRDVDAMNAWLCETVSAVDMRILMGPFSTRCDTPGNIGVTGVVVEADTP